MDDLEKCHPYDDAWRVVKELRVQVTDLRAALLAEQQQRSAEVMELRKEVQAINQESCKKHGEASKTTTDLCLDFKNHQSISQKHLDDLRTKHKQMHNQLTTSLKDENQER